MVVVVCFVFCQATICVAWMLLDLVFNFFSACSFDDNLVNFSCLSQHYFRQQKMGLFNFVAFLVPSCE